MHSAWAVCNLEAQNFQKFSQAKYFNLWRNKIGTHAAFTLLLQGLSKERPEQVMKMQIIPKDTVSYLSNIKQ